MKKLFSFEVRQKAQQFLDCERIEDLGPIGFDTNQVIYNAMHPSYYTFETRKKSGGIRTIEAPEYALKEIQRQFNFFFQSIYYTIQSPAAYGYIIRVKDEPYKKNILENARVHLGAKYMLNVDFENFFHQVSDQQVFQLLHTPPFRFNKKTALALTRIFTHKKRLPMGAPTSPVLSNISSLALDKSLGEWAAHKELNFTRFVDDMTFSSKSKAIEPAHFEEINAVCNAHQLKLNPAKTKFFGEQDTKKVTGLVLNDTIDIEPRFYKELDRDLQRLKHTAEVSLIMNKHNQDTVLKEFKQEVDGQINFIGMIEGYGSPVFFKYRQKMKAALNPNDEALSVRWNNFNYL